MYIYFAVIPLHSHALFVTVFIGLNFSEWHEQVQFHLGVIDLDLSLLNDKPTAITDKSSEDEKSFHKEQLSHIANIKIIFVCYSYSLHNCAP